MIDWDKVLAETRRPGAWKAKLERQAEKAHTDCEVETTILQMLSQGCENREIAQALDYSLQSVKRKVAIICIKLGAVNRTNAVAIALRKGLIN